MVRGDSDLRSVEDLRGRRVVTVLRANAGLEELHRGILATGGLSDRDVNAITVAGLPDAVQLLTDGRADAIPIGLDTALVLQAHATIPGGIRFITLGADEARLMELMPASRPVTVLPESISAGVTEPTRVPALDDYLNTGVHLGDDEAYAIVKGVHGGWGELRATYPQLTDTPAEAVAPADSPHPYHPGAILYFREAGLWTEAHEANQARALGEPSAATSL
jgi:TRAP transporter TAXI family solute receptor